MYDIVYASMNFFDHTIYFVIRSTYTYLYVSMVATSYNIRTVEQGYDFNIFWLDCCAKKKKTNCAWMMRETLELLYSPVSLSDILIPPGVEGP